MAVCKPWRRNGRVKTIHISALLMLLAFAIAGCEMVTGGNGPSYRSATPVTRASQIHVMAVVSQGADAVDRFALARIQSFAATELRLAGGFESVDENTSGTEQATGWTGKIIVGAYNDGSGDGNDRQQIIRGQILILEGADILAVYEIENLAFSGLLIPTNMRTVERGFAEKAAKAILAFE